MNNQLIEKIITSNNLTCPRFIYENPALDKNVAKALSKSFVKILNLSQAQQNSKTSNNLRQSILENIRKMCRVEPEKHVKVNEDLTAILLEFYEQINKNSTQTGIESTQRDLDAFLVRNLKDMNINSNHPKSQLNPEIVQALLNLNQNGIYHNELLKDIIHWNVTDNKNIQILKNLWASDSVCTQPSIAEDISIKFKTGIEKCLLEISYSILNDKDLNIDSIYNSNTDLKDLVNKASFSANCFQICYSILNYLFIMTNFDPRIQQFIQIFIENVKNSSSNQFSLLYPAHLSHIVVLLDTKIEELAPSIQKDFIESTNKFLSSLKCRNDLIMLLSHYPQWFDVYYK
ncbi:unnamed protein product [Spodoptera littoralis]|uniref:Uncharacterized protein n=1 Tax=Spodoptera littoralis TaxID=7109 RepID=A0A9P0I5K1_SPOLI|nr:unnamed protein product [Spodoptera littoralis]CAH1641479.1 unnamed protein product [Spodoptera littoralis]